MPVDFETETLGERLLQAGLDTTSPVFFSWLGVTPYLRMESIMATLAYIGTVARGGGRSCSIISWTRRTSTFSSG